MAGGPPLNSSLTSDLDAKKLRLGKVTAELASIPAVPPPRMSRGILNDLLQDGDGVSFHRFQMVVWTIVLGLVFINAVHRDLATPEFDATLLGLMGLSSGTYIGFKFSEKPK